jgi:FlaG protein
MLITAATSPPPARAETPKAVEREAKPAPENKPEATPQARVKSAPAPGRPSQYRLVYDNELSRTFIQIVDRESGEEIIRFPPEELVRFIDNTIGLEPAGSSSGLLVDRSV